MKRVLFLSGLVFCLSSCDNSGNNNSTADSSFTTNSTLMTDTNNASKNTGTDMSGGANSGSLTDSANRKDSGSNHE